MGLGTGIQIETGFDVNANKPIDSRFGPWADVASANAAIDAAKRHQGLTVGVLVSGEVVEYWYKDGVTDNDLVVKDESAAPVTTLKEIQEFTFSPAADDDTTVDISSVFGQEGTILDVYFNGALLLLGVDYNINTVDETIEWLDVDVTLKTWHVLQLKFRPE